MKERQIAAATAVCRSFQYRSNNKMPDSGCGAIGLYIWEMENTEFARYGIV